MVRMHDPGWDGPWRLIVREARWMGTPMWPVVRSARPGMRPRRPMVWGAHSGMGRTLGMAATDSKGPGGSTPGPTLSSLLPLQPGRLRPRAARGWDALGPRRLPAQVFPEQAQGGHHLRSAQPPIPVLVPGPGPAPLQPAPPPLPGCRTHLRSTAARRGGTGGRARKPRPASTARPEPPPARPGSPPLSGRPRRPWAGSWCHRRRRQPGSGSPPLPQPARHLGTAPPPAGLGRAAHPENRPWRPAQHGPGSRTPRWEARGPCLRGTGPRF